MSILRKVLVVVDKNHKLMINLTKVRRIFRQRRRKVKWVSQILKNYNNWNDNSVLENKKTQSDLDNKKGEPN